METIKKIASNDTVVRAAKTFVQAFFASLAVGVVSVDSWETAKALLVAGLASAISATWNGLKAKKTN